MEEKLPFKWRLAQVIADNYLSLLVLSFAAGFLAGLLLSSNG